MRFLKWSLLSVAGVVLGYGLYVAFAYESSAAYEGFPVPKGAEVTSEAETTRNYEWSRGSAENGIPMSYKLRIELAGWEEFSREGSLVTYRKGEQTVDVISDTDYLFLGLNEVSGG